MIEEDFQKAGAELFAGLLSDCVRSLSEMQILKSEILKNNLFSDHDEKDEILLLIDEIIWEETHAAERFRSERKKHLLAISNISKSVQERQTEPKDLPGGRPDNKLDGMVERARSGTSIPLFPEIKDP